MWQVAQQGGVIPDLAALSQNCLLLSLDLSRVVRMIAFACGVIYGQGRKTESGPERDYLFCVLWDLQMSLRV